jgi:hypothetical protein
VLCTLWGGAGVSCAEAADAARRLTASADIHRVFVPTPLRGRKRFPTPRAATARSILRRRPSTKRAAHNAWFARQSFGRSRGVSWGARKGG